MLHLLLFLCLLLTDSLYYRVAKFYFVPNVQKHELMNHVAHQAIVMQFILELAKSLKVDPRACIRTFFARFVFIAVVVVNICK